MKKVLCFLSALLFFSPCFAVDHSADEVLSWLNLAPKTTTRAAVTSLLGEPTKIEEGKKRTFWYYSQDNTGLVISWNNKSASMEKISFKSAAGEKKNVFDNTVQGKLKSGTTDIKQAIQLLGLPKDMTIKAATQELHYAYQKSVLRLFFRDRTLVDFTLLIQP